MRYVVKPRGSVCNNTPVIATVSELLARVYARFLNEGAEPSGFIVRTAGQAELHGAKWCVIDTRGRL